MAKKNGMSAVDWGALINQLLPLIQQIIDAFRPKKGVQAAVAKLQPALKAASECGPEECCCCLLSVQSKIFQDAVYFHSKVTGDENASQEDKDRAECLLACAAHGVLYAVKLHQECCHKDEEKYEQKGDGAV